MNGEGTIAGRVRIGCLILLMGVFPGFAAAQSVPGIEVPAGFEVIRVAGDDFATNVYSLAVSPRGDTYVAGPGYIKMLVDSNNDGIFDAVRQFSRRPNSGAQGICFDGADLLCTGDGGLWRYSDANQDGVSDGEPVKIFSIKTGGEHDAHAIRKGPDGWWYLLAGNGTPILPEFFAGATSPVTEPRAGFLMRISPDWSEKEVFAHGFRNAYDFDFNSAGDVFVYDSDGERDISLPWYQPTRLFQMRSGDDAGWVDAGWKRPGFYFDMPIEIGGLGRGSPTGVVAGSSRSFPSSYDDAIFVSDWTFGRVMAFRRDAASGAYDRGTDFAIANGQFGFAVTDLDFAPDGSLLISTGGRGTEGAIYRVRYVGQTERRPVAKQSPEFVRMARSTRLRADVLFQALNDPSQAIQISALEALIGRRDILGKGLVSNAELKGLLARGLQELLMTAEPKTLGMLMRVLKELDPSVLSSIDKNGLPVASQLMLESIVLDPSGEGSLKFFEKIAGVLANEESDSLLVTRIGQLALGGCGAEGTDPMFMGYTARSPVRIPAQTSKSIADQLAAALGRIRTTSENPEIDEFRIQEIGRLAAMLECSSSGLQFEMAELLSRTDSTAQQDIHWLNCVCQIIAGPENRLDEKLEPKIAAGLVGVSGKILRDHQNIDRNFHPRMQSLTSRICQRIGLEFSLMVATQLSGRDDQVFLLDALNGMSRDVAIPRFAANVESHPEQTTAEQLNVIASHSGGIYLPLVRKFSDRREFQDIIVASVARSPSAVDRRLFVDGLKSDNLKTVKNSAIGLQRLADQLTSDEIVTVYAALRRLAWEKSSVAVRDQLMMLLQNETGQDFGYQPNRNALVQEDVIERWQEFLQTSYPQEFSAEFEKHGVRALTQRLAEIDWAAGDSDRGKKIYVNLKCAQCHDAGSRLGPRLEGITKRFSREDVFRAITLPNDQVPERYRAIVIETVDGQFFQGSMVYESVDGITLQEIDGNTVRINRNVIEARAVSDKSLMPDGLLKEASDQDWADLFAYLNQ